MFRHVVLLTLSGDTPAGQLEQIRDELLQMAAGMDEVAGYSVGLDAGISEGNATVAVVGDFANADDYRTYAADAVHQQIIADHIKPWITARSAVQYDF